MEVRYSYAIDIVVAVDHRTFHKEIPGPGLTGTRTSLIRLGDIIYDANYDLDEIEKLLIGELRAILNEDKVVPYVKDLKERHPNYRIKKVGINVFDVGIIDMGEYLSLEDFLMEVEWRRLFM